MNYVFEKCEYSKPLIQRVNELNTQAKFLGHDTVDVELVKKGVAFAKYWHGDQMRKSGDPYYSHPIAVAMLAMEQEFSMNIVVGALLHDVLEDSNCTFDIISHEFTPRIAQIVYRLTRIRDGKKFSVNFIVKELIEFNDTEASIIKICDRTHNMQNMQYLPYEKQIEICLETLNLFPELIQIFLCDLNLEKSCVECALFIINKNNQLSYTKLATIYGDLLYPPKDNILQIY